jgi:bifunctional non-homologous end joining protein LigD
VEVEYLGWSGSGRLRHAVFLGVREDKAAEEVVRDIPDQTAPRVVHGARPAQTRRAVIVEARPPAKGDAVRLSHPDRELWPGIRKQDLAEYWRAVGDAALPGIARRPLAVVRCPDGIEGERFFQKHRHNALPKQVREGEAGGAPYLAIDDADGLIAMAQMSAIELHCWGSSEDDPLHPDRIVFDLDPDEAIPFPDVVQAAKDVRDRLQKIGLTTFCRTTGGKGLHVVAPLVPEADWDTVRAFCKGFAEAMVQAEPDRFVSTVSKKLRRGRILIDWLRNGLGATAVVSFSPRARPGATVATPLAWREVTSRLDPSAYTIQTIPQRLARQRGDPWGDFATTRQKLPRELFGTAGQKQGRRKS